MSIHNLHKNTKRKKHFLLYKHENFQIHLTKHQICDMLKTQEGKKQHEETYSLAVDWWCFQPLLFFAYIFIYIIIAQHLENVK